MPPADFATIFAELRDILLTAAPPMVVVTDTNGSLLLNTEWTEKRTKAPAFFGQVSVKKSYEIGISIGVG